jgi:hypothetical protein
MQTCELSGGPFPSRACRRLAPEEGPVYSWFTEGFNTPDLTEFKARLDELI